MKIAVLSDTHVPRVVERLPESLCKRLEGVDLILHAGDLTEMSVYERLSRIARTVAVSGNMDDDQIKRCFVPRQIVEAGGKRIGLVHGEGSYGMCLQYVQEVFARDKVDMVVFGHTHMPFSQVIGGVLYFNPGSATDIVFAETPSYGMLQIDQTIIPAIVRV